jgi:uncharacterized protein (TIGR02594 family)
MSRPFWLNTAINYLGTEEIPGRENNPIILDWWKKIKQGGIKDDETAWCAAFVGGVLEERGITSSRSAGARSYQNWGVKIAGPAVGAVVTFWRDDPKGWKGHVGFVVGKDQLGNLMVLGGNQQDGVNIKPFATARVLAYCWPKSMELPKELGIKLLPLVRSDGRLSTNEA